jgi:hypothetical protein
MPSLILKRANTSRPDGQWKDEDYDVLANGEVDGAALIWPCFLFQNPAIGGRNCPRNIGMSRLTRCAASLR